MESIGTVMIHPTAEVHTKQIGEDTRIWQHCVILEGAMIGRNCNINCFNFIENDVKIGDNVTIKSGVYLWDGTTIGDKVFVGQNATFLNNTYPRSKQYPEKHIGATLEEGVSIGANATIFGGITVGKYSMIGAGAVLTKSTGPYELWAGNPASQIGYVTEDGQTLNMELEDPKTGKIYMIRNDKLELR